MFALGIRLIGSRAAKLIAERFGTIDSVAEANAEQIAEIPDIGEKMAGSVEHYFSESASIELVEHLRKCGVDMTYEAVKKGGIFSGKTFVITGTLPGMKRSESKKLIEDNGGKVSSSVSKKTDYLLAGDEAGSKLDKANKLGIDVISEEDLEKMLDNNF